MSLSYRDWLDTLALPIRYFVDWLVQISNSLCENYFFITLLGITIFVSLFWVVFYIISFIYHKYHDRFEDYNDKYYNYELFKEVQSDYLDNHYTDEYDYRYRSKVLNSQVLNGYLHQNKDLDIDNKRLANKNKMESLKEIKEEILNDDDSSNDNDIDLIVPPKPQLANWNELKQAQLRDMQEELKKDINSEIERIESENKDLVEKLDYYNINGVKIPMSIWKNNEFNTDNFDYINGHITDLRTGEVYDGACPIPPGPISLSNMSQEELDKIKRFNDLQQAKLDSGNWRSFHSKREHLDMDEDLEAQLFL